ncbi:hypothetical protein D3C84_592050 [compost metagenome]
MAQPFSFLPVSLLAVAEKLRCFLVCKAPIEYGLENMAHPCHARREACAQTLCGTRIAGQKGQAQIWAECF